jgi:hypothetical protein
LKTHWAREKWSDLLYSDSSNRPEFAAEMLKRAQGHGHWTILAIAWKDSEMGGKGPISVNLIKFKIYLLSPID